MKHCAFLVVAALLCSSGLARAEDGKNSTVKETGSGRIIGGYVADIASYPYTVVVTAYLSPSPGSPFFISCGGVIIASTKVLTAAQCLYQQNITLITIRAGSNFRLRDGFVFNHLNYVVHSQYDAKTFANDVAVITIKGTFDHLKNVSKIILQPTEPVISSVKPTACFVVGWGWVNLEGVSSTTLQRANYVLMPQTTCASRLYQLTSTTICAQSIQGDACRGDTGGPLVCGNRLHGVVSFGPLNCNGNSPDGFAKITAPSIRSFITTYAGV